MTIKRPILLFSFICICLNFSILKIEAQVTKGEIVKRTKESVDWIHAFGMQDNLEESNYKTGTGYVASEKGLIVTNHHVIKDANGLMIFSPKRETPIYGIVVWSDNVADLAVIKAFNCDLILLRFENPDRVKQGDETLIFGYPGSGVYFTSERNNQLYNHQIRFLI